MSTMKENVRRVKIRDVYRGDAGRGRIRIDPRIIKELNLKTGDAIGISNPATNKTTAALLYPGKDEDKSSNAIRIDSSIRRNLDATLDDFVEIQKIQHSPAERVTFAGVEESVIIRDPNRLVRMLENRLITKGDILSFNAMGRRIDFIVVDYAPLADAVRVHLETKITISEKTYKELEELESKRVTFEDVGGLEEEIQMLREIILMPINHPEIFQRLNIKPLNGVLLYSNPGVGKTLLVEALINEANVHSVTIEGPEIFNKFEGESENNLRAIFKEAESKAPSIIFINRISAIAPKSEDPSSNLKKRIVDQLLILLDGINKKGDIVVIAETNDVKGIHEALIRSGRFDREIEIKPPDTKGRLEILRIHTRGMPLNEDVDLGVIAEKTQGLVGVDLELLVKEVAMLAMREILPHIEDDKPVPPKVLSSLQIKMEHFLAALNKINPIDSN
ncbi:MAG: hypothetical protein CEE42_08240 [Promethearchaeota archaeon Loki_b31]|nr:MAG: hypothetical protein CEE42_08240 [Candidatus Lokiarchaeota archaeon Loki_b31]